MESNLNKRYSTSYTQLQLDTGYTDRPKNEPGSCFLLRVLFFLMGIIILMPFNFMVTANNYWMHRLKNDSLNSTDLSRKNIWQQYFSSAILIAEGIALAITGTLMFFVGRKINLISRIYVALAVFVFCLTFNLLSVFIKVRNWQNVTFCIALLLAFLMNCTCSVFHVSAMAFVSKFPKKYLKYFLYGQGYSGVIISTISLSTIAIGNNPEKSVLIYFSGGIILLAVTIFLLRRSEYTSMYSQCMDNQQENTKSKHASMSEIVRITKNIWPCIVIFQIMLSAVMTLHPGLTALIVSENYGQGNLWNDKFFIPVITFLFTDICGVIGRYFGTGFVRKSNAFWLIIFMIARLLLFIWLVLHCNISPRKNLPVYFNHDWEYIMIVGSMTFSNGFFHSSIVLSLDRLERDNKEMAFTIFSAVTMIFSIAYYPLGPILVSIV